MNPQMAYLLGMILGNGEIQRGNRETTVTISIPFKNLEDDEGRDVPIYTAASITRIRETIEPLVERTLTVAEESNAVKMSFTKPNQDYTMREIVRYIENGTHHRTMTMNPELFDVTREEKRELLRGIADVTGHIRSANKAWGHDYEQRVYIEVPANWQMVIDISNMLKDLDVPIQNIDFAHPNLRDPQAKKYYEGKPYYWKKEHQIKIYANEFLPIGFNIEHKHRALEELSAKNIAGFDTEKTHKYYWERRRVRRLKASHPGENDNSLPSAIRGKHYESWMDIAEDLGYHD